MSSTLPAFLKALKAEGLGEAEILTDPVLTAPFCADWRGLKQTSTPAVLRPQTTGQVQAIMRQASTHGVRVTPQGGNTGLVLGSIPLNEDEVVLSLGRMNQIRALDPVNATITVDAGCVLDRIKDQADQAGYLFPLSLGAKGTCQIGGNLATNAGGINVLRYGNVREQCLGLEVVLADGRLVRDLTGLRKDNRGMDLTRLFIGSEGQLGIITGAVLRLFPKPAEHVTFAAALSDASSAMALLQTLKDAIGEQITSFEIIHQNALEPVKRFSESARVPFDTLPPYLVIGEASLFSALDAQREAIFETLMAMLEDEANSMYDVIVCQSEGERSSLWHLREEVVLCQKEAGPSIKHDVSVPLSAIPDLFKRGMPLAQTIVPGCVPAPFGHAGDGNLHFNITAPSGWSTEAFFAYYEPMNRAIHDLVHELGGSFSAEHGIGSQKRTELPDRLDGDTLDVMRTLKAALDPKGLLNAGKVL